MNLIDRLYEEQIGAIVIGPDGVSTESVPDQPLVLAGSFNPLHDGHLAMLDAAQQMVNRQAYFEISIENVDKPRLAKSELQKRAAQISKTGGSLIVTNAQRFTEKSSLIPGAIFVIGMDTYIRLMDGRYYPDHVAGDHSAVENSLDLIDENGCSFIVAGRVDDRNQFTILHDIDFEVPMRFKDMFTELTETQFRSDLSSTEIRNKR
ncbi:MAG: hypothetical protein CL784_08030 [Chloroflexi bacterium]|nr:hypothetical protein [Chloroflexota bacterium]|tara:strand:- start:866 stop:1483 length:618 start_codon:yes stop_codon:yes gene_type:complete